ncbi:hypothetical protein [Legionella maioricensis]|uniref:Uncharacterized protein n=1 Tax=Legionella maioricensis TaxID=2896528 RepID=A0A9X2CZM2_9GAMM|nr:hypothetical protein [Legionella maioricensis]MCL9683860.1 hypothetical protein [Legionella maioricensis]MCL9686707.1 hypothetical protein [Legionella maioricensis]
MISVIKLVAIFFFIGCSLTALAANIPSDNLGAEKYDAIKCVADATQNCINSVCLNSSQRNCQGSCAKMAQQKCRAENYN